MKEIGAWTAVVPPGGLKCRHEWRAIFHAAGGLSTPPDAARESVSPVRRALSQMWDVSIAAGRALGRGGGGNGRGARLPEMPATGNPARPVNPGGFCSRTSSPWKRSMRHDHPVATVPGDRATLKEAERPNRMNQPHRYFTCHPCFRLTCLGSLLTCSS
jgi:hypothetical protein